MGVWMGKRDDEKEMLRTEEEKAAGGLFGAGEAGAGAQHGFGDGVHGFVLPHHTLVEDITQGKELLFLCFWEGGWVGGWVGGRRRRR